MIRHTPADAVIYAIGDVHGRLDLLDAIHERIAADASRRAAAHKLLIYLGDYVSRGADSRAVVDRVREWQPDEFEVVWLKGNHEDLLLRFLDGEIDAGRHWFDYDGLDTLALVVRDTLVSDTILFFTRVSHQPRILSLLYQNTSVSYTQDSTAVHIQNGVPDTFVLNVSDPDVLIDDSLAYVVRVDGATDTAQTLAEQAFTYIHHPGTQDRRAILHVTDGQGFSDSVIVDFLYPAFSYGSGHTADSLYLADSISLFVTRSVLPRDSVSAKSRALLVKNTGTDTLQLSQVFMKSGLESAGWLRFGWSTVPDVSGVTYSGRLSDTRAIPPSDSIYLVVRDSAAVPFTGTGPDARTTASGDTILYDTLGLVTSGPSQAARNGRNERLYARHAVL